LVVRKLSGIIVVAIASGMLPLHIIADVTMQYRASVVEEFLPCSKLVDFATRNHCEMNESVKGLIEK